MIIVRFVTIGGKELYKTESDDIDVIINNLNQAMVDLNIIRHVSIEDSFDELDKHYLNQETFMSNAKQYGIYMTGGTIDDKHIQMIYQIV